MCVCVGVCVCVCVCVCVHVCVCTCVCVCVVSLLNYCTKLCSSSPHGVVVKIMLAAAISSLCVCVCVCMYVCVCVGVRVWQVHNWFTGNSHMVHTTQKPGDPL